MGFCLGFLFLIVGYSDSRQDLGGNTALVIVCVELGDIRIFLLEGTLESLLVGFKILLVNCYYDVGFSSFLNPDAFEIVFIPLMDEFLFVLGYIGCVTQFIV